MYGPKLAPKLPANFREVLTVLGLELQLCFNFILFDKNIAASLLITIIFFVTNVIINKYFILEQFFININKFP